MEGYMKYVNLYIVVRFLELLTKIVIHLMKWTKVTVIRLMKWKEYMIIFELHDCIVGKHVSFHLTIKGAMLAMSKEIEKLAPALDRDYEGYINVDFELNYRIVKHKVGE